MSIPALNPRVIGLLIALGFETSGFGQMARASTERESILTRPDVFPIGVWMQPTRHSAEYKNAGINCYVGLWKGPTEEQLAELKQNGMPVFCEMNDVAMRHLADPGIIGWLQMDEPDNSQKAGNGKGFDPPIKPSAIVSTYDRIKKADSTRPVMLNLGKGVSDETFGGRGVRTGKLEDYPSYIRGCDIVSFDIYPVAGAGKESGKLWYVARGVERLVKWTAGKKPVWNAIEASRIGSGRVATSEQIRSMVWMSIIRGSRGIIYFVHQFKPTIDESALLHDSVTLNAVTEINKQVQELAPVINSPSVTNVVTVKAEPSHSTVAMDCHVQGGKLYWFVCNLGEAEATATFELSNQFSAAKVSELGDGKERALKGRTFSESLPPYAVRLYRADLPAQTGPASVR